MLWIKFLSVMCSIDIWRNNYSIKNQKYSWDLLKTNLVSPVFCFFSPCQSSGMNIVLINIVLNNYTISLFEPWQAKHKTSSWFSNKYPELLYFWYNGNVFLLNFVSLLAFCVGLLSIKEKSNHLFCLSKFTWT